MIMVVLLAFSTWAAFAFKDFDISNLYLFLGADVIILAILYVNVKDHAYPELEVDFKKMQAIQKPTFAFMSPKTVLFKAINGVDLKVKPISGYASPFEEGNTDYRKKLVLTTNNEDITLFSYINRKKELEKSAEILVSKLQGMITPNTLV